MSHGAGTPPEPTDPAMAAEADRQFEILRRGSVDIIEEADLRRRLAASLAAGRPLRVKLGVDPTAPDLHLGFTVALNKLRLFQDLGHQAVLILGDATARVGDPSGRNRARPSLSGEEIDRNAETYLAQAGRVLDVSKLEVRRNSEWLSRLDFEGLVRLASRATVARTLERDDFSRRWRAGTPIHLHEFLYPLFQGYDSVVVRADVELGGTDQLFNLLVGRDLQADAGQPPQICMTNPLLVGLDGERKMSKSWGNVIGITDPPEEMYGRVMSIPDGLVRDWFVLLTTLPAEEIERLMAAGVHPRDRKDRLAREITARYHGEAAAAAAADRFIRIHRLHEAPEEMPVVTIPAAELEDGTLAVARLIVLAAMASSMSEARRLVEQGGVTLEGAVLGDPRGRTPVRPGNVLRVGKRRFCRLEIGSE